VRGVPLRERAELLRVHRAKLEPHVDAPAIGELWAQALARPAYAGPPRWLHGDLHPANLLVRAGRLTAVLDFGDLTGGDPASDLAVAWMLFPPGPRQRFRAAVPHADDACWQRAHGWALALAVAMLANSADDPRIQRLGAQTLRRVLEERGR
jgi:aminoglycoside phosphotransferase (APT) family kinase protein